MLFTSEKSNRRKNVGLDFLPRRLARFQNVFRIFVVTSGDSAVAQVYI